MKSFKLISLIAVTALALGVADPALAKHNGFGTKQGQGNINNDNVQNNPGTVTETGPKGALKNGNTPDNTVTTCGPGKGKNGC